MARFRRRRPRTIRFDMRPRAPRHTPWQSYAIASLGAGLVAGLVARMVIGRLW